VNNLKLLTEKKESRSIFLSCNILIPMFKGDINPNNVFGGLILFFFLDLVLKLLWLGLFIRCLYLYNNISK